MSRYLWCGAPDSYAHLAGFATNIQQGTLARKLSAPSTPLRTRRPFQDAKNLAALVARVQEPSSMLKMAEKGRYSNGAIGTPLEVGSADTKCHFSSCAARLAAVVLRLS
jgi:hypothetical protein